MDTITNNNSFIIEKQNKTNIITSAALLLMGLVLTFHSHFLKTEKNLGITLIIMGVLLIIIGATLLILKAKQKVYVKTGSVVKSKVLYISRDDLTFAKNLLANGKFENEKAIATVDTGNVYLDIHLTKDKCFASAQIYEFIPYDFQPVTQIYYYTDHQALKFCEYLERCKR